jgi:hypothetical protein
MQIDFDNAGREGAVVRNYELAIDGTDRGPEIIGICKFFNRARKHCSLQAEHVKRTFKAKPQDSLLRIIKKEDKFNVIVRLRTQACTDAKAQHRMRTEVRLPWFSVS